MGIYKIMHNSVIFSQILMRRHSFAKVGLSFDKNTFLDFCNSFKKFYECEKLGTPSKLYTLNDMSLEISIVLPSLQRRYVTVGFYI